VRPHTSSRPALLALVTAALTAGLVLPAAPALAAPTCVDPLTRAACGGRIVPEAALSVSQHQFDGTADNIADTLAAMADVAPEGFFTPMSLGKSAGGRDLWVVKITDPSVPQSEKVQSAVSLSVHGLEPAGREGGLRYLEDLATWLASDKEHLLYAGETGVPVGELFKKVEYYVAFTNPDGWAKQDLDDDNVPGTEPRTNDNGADLNRDFPTKGWVDRGGGRGPLMDQPETKLWYALLQSLPDLRSAGDIHGELTSVNKAFSDIMWPAGQWSPDKQAKELQLAKDMIATVERKFEEDGVVLGELFDANDTAGDPTGEGLQPANVATGYDVVGYDDSGFMGDSMGGLNGNQVVEIDVENFLSHAAPNVLWASPLEQAHVAAVRGNMEALLVTALKERTVTASLDLGKVAYVDDPARVTSADGTGFDLEDGETQKPYDVSRLAYFRDLAADAGTTIPGIAAADVATADLSGYDTIVLSDVEVPKDTKGRPVDRAGYVTALKAFTEAGGQLVLTDAAVTLLDDIGTVPADAQTMQRTNAGHVDFVEGDHPFKEGLFGAPSQTYYEVPLGFPAENQSPHHGVARTVWEEAGGTTVGTVGDSTVLGEIAQGKGKVTIFGAILPQAVESLDELETPHPEGLVDYALTIAGGQVLHNVLAYRASGRTTVTPVVNPVDEAPTGSPTLPTTGATTLPALTGLLLLGGLAVRRRLRATS
jgi:hypothetical protein